VQFSIFLSFFWAFDPFLPGGARLGWGKKHGLGHAFSLHPHPDPPPSRGRGYNACSHKGFDHGVGHPLLVLYDAKTPCGQKTNEFNAFWHDPSNTALSLF